MAHPGQEVGFRRVGQLRCFESRSQLLPPAVFLYRHVGHVHAGHAHTLQLPGNIEELILFRPADAFFIGQLQKETVALLMFQLLADVVRRQILKINTPILLVHETVSHLPDLIGENAFAQGIFLTLVTDCHNAMPSGLEIDVADQVVLHLRHFAKKKLLRLLLGHIQRVEKADHIAALRIQTEAEIGASVKDRIVVSSPLELKMVVLLAGVKALENFFPLHDLTHSHAVRRIHSRVCKMLHRGLEALANLGRNHVSGHDTALHPVRSEVDAALSAALREGKKRKIAQFLFVELFLLLFPLLILGDIHADRHPALPAVLSLDTAARIMNPDIGAVLLLHPIVRGVTALFVEPFFHLVLRPLPVLGVNAVSQKTVYIFDEFLSVLVTQIIQHTVIDKVYGAAFLPVTADHAAGKGGIQEFLLLLELILPGLIVEIGLVCPLSAEHLLHTETETSAQPGIEDKIVRPHLQRFLLRMLILISHDENRRLPDLLFPLDALPYGVVPFADSCHADEKSGNPVSKALYIPQNFRLVDSSHQFITVFKKLFQLLPLLFPVIHQKKDAFFLLFLADELEGLVLFLLLRDLLTKQRLKISRIHGLREIITLNIIAAQIS